MMTSIAFAQTSLKIPLTVVDNAGYRADVIFGVDAEASDCIDPSLGEFELPGNQCGTSTVCMYLSDDGAEGRTCLGAGVLLDLRRYFSSSQIDTYCVHFSAQNYPLTFHWPSNLTNSYYSVRMSFTQDASHPIADMLLVDSLRLNDPTANKIFIFAWGPKPVINGIKDNGSLPANYILRQNYPNPFNPSTTISYELPNVSHVRAIIFDASGTKVATLIDTRQGAGRYKIQWDAHQMPSGVYFCRLTADQFVMTKKLLLMK
jgi:hypothetical protein